MPRIWQVTAGDHCAALDVLFDRNPNRSAARAAWGQSEFIFVAAWGKDSSSAEIHQWLEETGIPHWMEAAGAFTFFEFKTESDAVAFKLRWI